MKAKPKAISTKQFVLKALMFLVELNVDAEVDVDVEVNVDDHSQSLLLLREIGASTKQSFGQKVFLIQKQRNPLRMIKTDQLFRINLRNSFQRLNMFFLLRA